MMKTDSYFEYYNLRYGAFSSKDYTANSLKTPSGLVYFTQVAFIVLMIT